MKAIFAPWRMDFILGKREKGCVFCNRSPVSKKKHDRKNLLLHRGKHSFVILNKYPYNNGHLMVVPYRHIASMMDLTHEERDEMFYFLTHSEKVLRKLMKPQGFNVGMNLGKAAGAGIEDHLHIHIVPRWLADTNFWPVLADTKSMPQHLMDSYDLLKKSWGKSL